MIDVVSIERAIAEGTSPGELRAIADWHSDRIPGLQRDLERAAPRNRSSYGRSIERHRRLCAKLIKQSALLVAALEEKAAA